MIYGIALFGYAIAVILAGAFWLERNMHFATKEKLLQCQTSLTTLADQHKQLKTACELDKAKIKKAMEKLAKQRTVKVIEIPKVDDECQALKIMIDDASKEFSD